MLLNPCATQSDTLDAIDLDALQDDGDTIDLPNGDTLRLRIDIDDLPVLPLQDHGDCWGKTSEYSYDYARDGHEPRPQGFTGNAEKIQVGRGDWIWWEPPEGVPRGSAGFSALRSSVRDLVEMGFIQVGVELLRGVDAYRRPVVIDAAWIGGVDSIDGEQFGDRAYLRDLVDDLVAMLDFGTDNAGQ